jgi:hypothetical protein
MILSFISGCKKNESGHILYNLSYTSSILKSTSAYNGLLVKSAIGSQDNLYTQFGQYITSLTPDKFTAKFQTIRFNSATNMNNGGHNLELVDNNASPDALERFADFTNNTSINITPHLYGGVDKNGMFAEDEINFVYFFFMLQYFYQEVALPDQYNGINISQFNHNYNNKNYSSDLVISNNILKVDHFPLIDALFSERNLGYPNVFAFGNTDSTYISTTEGTSDIYGMGSWILIRSNKYSSFILHKPQDGKTLDINTILSFNSNGLIQIYAGKDNIPYTSDDVFVYAPYFWERLSVKVNMN